MDVMGNGHRRGNLPDKRGWRGRFRVLAMSVVVSGFFVCCLVPYAYLAAIVASSGRLFTEVANVPATEVGLVFGTTDRVSGRENLYFRYRIEAAVRLWKAGKIKTVIVSGDNRTRYYNEPEKMRQALIDRGIPQERIICDSAGLRTLDSVVRAKVIFGANPILFISQRFQNQRAIYLAKANGIEAFGYNARDVEAHVGLRTQIREIGARFKMWLDVNLLGTRPRHLGKKIALPQ